MRVLFGAVVWLLLLSGCPASGGADASSGLGPPDLSCTRTRLLDGKADAPSRLTIGFAVEDCQGRPVTGLTSTDLRVEEDGAALGAGVVLTPTDALTPFVTLAIDVSRPTGEHLTEVVAAASAFVTRAQQDAVVPAQIAIEVFDGQAASVVWQEHTLDTQLLLARLQAVPSFAPPDPGSTNLFGAVRSAMDRLSSAEAAFKQRNGGGSFAEGYVVVFTAGKDTSGRVTEAEASMCGDPSVTVDASAFCIARTPIQLPGSCPSGGPVCPSSATGCCPSGTGCVSSPAGYRCTLNNSSVSCDSSFSTACPQSLSCSPNQQCCCSTQECVDGYIGQICGRRGSNRLVVVGADAGELDLALFRRIAPGAVFSAPPPALEQAAQSAADLIAARRQGAYVLRYCSAKRVDSRHSTQVEMKQGSVAAAKFEFSATFFTPGCEAATLSTACEGKACGALACGSCDDRVSWCDLSGSSCRAHCERDAGYCGMSYTSPQGYSYTCTDSPTATACDGGCVNVLTDTQNCGACGVDCATNTQCRDGGCTCTAPFAACDAGCLEVQRDALNCGACGNFCPPNSPCIGGQCRCPLVTQMACSGECVTLTTSFGNCGSCGRVCPVGASCTAGVCACPMGQPVCNGRCTDISSDARNCAACGRSCGDGGVCGGARCQEIVATGLGTARFLTIVNGTLYLFGSGQLRRVDRTTGAVSVVAPIDADPFLNLLLIRNGTAYWRASFFDVHSMPLDGGAVTTVFAYSQSLADFDIEGDFAYFVTGNGVNRAPLDGGPAIVIASNQSAMEVEVDSTDVFFLGGPAPQQLRRVSMDGGAVTTLETASAPGVSALQAEGGFTYFSRSGTLNRRASSGMITPLDSNATSYLRHGSDVFWWGGIPTGGSAIFAAPLSGAQRRAAATFHSGGMNSPDSASTYAVWNREIYWLSRGTLWRTSW